MIIIIEGPDGAGKTTFVDLLSKKLPRAAVLRSGPPEPPDRDPFEEYERRLYEYVSYDPYRVASEAPTPVICDRWHWGERVYGPLLRGRDRLTDAGWRHVELLLAAQGAVVVWLHQPSSVLLDRLDSRGDDLITRGDLVHVDVGYQWCLRNTILPVIGLRDPDDGDAEDVISLSRSGLGARFTTYVGSPRPRCLLFGERRAGEPPYADRSAFVPRANTSGYYLLSNLSEALWPHVGLCNALEEDVAEVHWELGEVPAVALGRGAHDALTRADVPHATVPHPQFARRFLHSRLPEYGRLIEDVIGTTEDRLDWRGLELDEKETT